MTDEQRQKLYDAIDIDWAWGRKVIRCHNYIKQEPKSRKKERSDANNR